KTVALGMVLAPRLLEAAASGGGARVLRALVIVPTRELAVQVSAELRWLYASVPGLTVECVTGGSSVGQERYRLEQKPTLVVGTPGRMYDHISRRAIDCSRVAEVVLDEADRMFDMGFREELEAILDATPSDRATHLVSATFPPAIQKLARKYQNDPLSVQGTRLGDANEDIEHVGHLIRPHDRYDAIVNLLLLAKDERTLVFVNTRAEASGLADQLADDGFAAAPISGDLEQFQRTQTLGAFRNGTKTVLVATDVAARGLDVPEVAMVIQTDAPLDAESYTHRAGRTGRAGRKGRSILFVSPQRRRRVESLLARAKLTMEWREVPTAAEVEKALAKQARRRLREALTSASEPNEKQLAHASALLEEMDPATLVARLVELCRDADKAAPREVDTVSARANQARGPERRPASRDRSAPRGRSSEAHKSSTRGSDARAATFEINWGHRDGATPQRLLAHLCRRGAVTGRMIGAIDIDSRMTSFEVADSVARQFESSAGIRDARDPHLLIRRARRGRR
ncbi:MAG: DEAD/DEAH box helicase, partial [Candidatus Binatia bacterium]